MPITVILYIVLFFGGIWKAFTSNPIWGLWPYAMSLYISPNYYWIGSFLPKLRWSLLASVCVFLSVLFNGERLTKKSSWTKNGAAKILIAYVIWMWIQLGWALSYDIHLEACILMTKYIILFFIIYRIISKDKDYFIFFIFNIIGGFVISISVLNYSIGGRVEGIGGPGINDSNSLGMHMSVILIFSSMMLLKKNTLFSNTLHWKIFKGLIFVGILFIANAVVQTISRSAVLGLSAACIVLIMIMHKSIKKYFYICLIFAFFGSVYFVPYTFWNRVRSIPVAIQTGQIDPSAFSRLVTAQAQIDMFTNNVFGYGHRGTAILSPSYLPEIYLTSLDGKKMRASHCTFLTTLVEQGFPGAILYWLMVFWVIKTIHSIKKDNLSSYIYVMAIAASLACIFVSGFFVDYLKAEIQIYCLAMLASLKELQDSKAQKPEMNNFYT